MMSLLDQVHPLAKDKTLEHQAQLSVRGDIEGIKEAIDSQRWPPGAVAIFSCSGRDLYEEVLLRSQLREQVIVDATPFARPMLAVLSEYHLACILVINKASARVWEVDSDQIREVGVIKDRVLRKPDYAASLAEDRVHNKEEELVKRHYRRTVKLLEDLQQTDGYDIVIVGGHDHEVPEFLQILPNELRNRVAGTFSVRPGHRAAGRDRQQRPLASWIATSARRSSGWCRRARESRDGPARRAEPGELPACSPGGGDPDAAGAPGRDRARRGV